jgi:hypothetical protein
LRIGLARNVFTFRQRGLVETRGARLERHRQQGAKRGHGGILRRILRLDHSAVGSLFEGRRRFDRDTWRGNLAAIVGNICSGTMAAAVRADWSFAWVGVAATGGAVRIGIGPTTRSEMSPFVLPGCSGEAAAGPTPAAALSVAVSG